MVKALERLIEVFRPPSTGDEWVRVEARAGSIALVSVDAGLSVDEVYSGVEL